MAHPKEKLPDYALGLLDPDEMADVGAHLETCEACREEVRRFDATLTAWVDALPEVEPPPQAKANLFERIKNKPVPAAPVATKIASATSHAILTESHQRGYLANRYKSGRPPLPGAHSAANTPCVQFALPCVTSGRGASAERRVQSHETPLSFALLLSVTERE